MYRQERGGHMLGFVMIPPALICVFDFDSSNKTCVIIVTLLTRVLRRQRRLKQRYKWIYFIIKMTNFLFA